MMYVIEANIGPNQWIDIDRTQCPFEADQIAEDYKAITGNEVRITEEDGEG